MKIDINPFELSLNPLWLNQKRSPIHTGDLFYIFG